MLILNNIIGSFHIIQSMDSKKYGGDHTANTKLKNAKYSLNTVLLGS